MCHAGILGDIVGKLRQAKSTDFQDGLAPPPVMGQLVRLLSIDPEVRVKLVWGTECLGLSPLWTGVGGGHRCPAPGETALGNLSPLAGSSAPP